MNKRKNLKINRQDFALMVNIEHYSENGRLQILQILTLIALKCFSEKCADRAKNFKKKSQPFQSFCLERLLKIHPTSNDEGLKDNWCSIGKTLQTWKSNFRSS